MFPIKYLLLALFLIGYGSTIQAQEVPMDTSAVSSEGYEDIDPPTDLDEEDSEIDSYPEAPISPIDTTPSVNSEYNLLQVSGSAAGDLLGLTPGLIQTPSDPTNFLARVANTTHNFTALPAFGMDFAPAWIYGGKNIKYENFTSNNIFDNIWQSLTISTAVNTTVYPDTFTQIGGGIKISLLRGKVPHKIDSLYHLADQKLSEHITNLDSLSRIANQDSISQDYAKKMKALAAKGKQDTKAYKRLQEKAKSRHRLKFKMATDSLKQNLDSLALNAKQINFSRYGFKCDLSVGASANYLDNLYENGTLGNAGAWLTGGYEMQSGTSIMGHAKYLYHNPMDVDTLNGINYSSFDLGAKLNFPDSKGKFSFSIEAIYRQVFDDTAMASPSWGITATVNYKLPPASAYVPSTILSFSFGRGFSGDLTGAQPIIAGMHFFKGLGSSRPKFN